jgi:hypothetical protein
VAHQTDAAKCFDMVKDVRAGMPKTVPTAYNRPIADQTDAWSPYDKSLGGFWEGGTHWSEVVRDHTLDFPRRCEAAGEAFLHLRRLQRAA